MKTTLSCSLLSAALLCSAVSVTQTYRDSGNAVTARNGRSIVFRDHDNRPLATLPLPPGNRVNAEMKRNAIRLDLRNSTVNTSRNLPLNFELPKTVSSSGFAGQKIRFTVRLNADRDAEVMMMLMQKTDKWQGSSKRFRIGKNPVTLLFETSASQRLSGLSPRIGFHTPAIYTVEEMRLETFREESTATGNQLPNGGAERGWLGTYGDPIRVQGDSGRIQWLDGSWQTRDREFALDSREFHSGKTSFRITATPNAANRFYVGPVKVVPGQPLRVTYWAKASRPNTATGMFLLCNSSSAFGFPPKSQIVGTEWKKISLLVPRWGQGGIGLDGNMNVHNETYLCFSPQTDATIWIDDISASVGSPELPPADLPFAVSGIMNAPNCNYAPGDRISAGITISNLSGSAEKYKVSARLLDYYGSVRWQKTIGTFDCAARQERTIQLPLTEAETLLGSQNLIVSVRDSAGRTMEHGYLFGRTRGDNTPVPRIAMDLSSRSNSGMTLDLLKLTRAGTARIWAQFRLGKENPSLDYMARIHDGGIRTLLCAGPLGMKGAAIQKDPTVTVAEYRKRLAPYASKLDVLEFCNEPNIWKARLTDPGMTMMTEQNYVKYLAPIRQALKEIAPHVKLAGPTVCTVDSAWIGQVLREGGDKLLDIITLHPYCITPEEYGLKERLESLNGTIRRDTGKTFPVWCSEKGSQYSAILVNNLIDGKSRTGTAEDLRTMILAFAGGAEVYTHFKLIPYGTQTTWNIVLGGTPANGYQPILHPAGYAFRAFADLVGNAPFAGICQLGTETRCVVFDGGKTRTAILWKWKGASARLNTKELERHGTFFDIMGNPVPAGQVILDNQPLYYTTSLTLSGLKDLCSRLEIPSNLPPLSISPRIINASTFVLDVINHGNRPADGTLSVIADGTKSSRKLTSIPPEGKSSAKFHTKHTICLQPQTVQADISTGGKQYPHTFQLRAMTVPRTKKPIVIDGDLREWDDVPRTVLTVPSNAVRRNPALWTKADETIRVEIQSQWSPSHLYCAVTVHKPVDFAAADAPNDLYNVDSIQLAFDPQKNAKPGKGYDDDDFEYTFGRWKNKPAVIRHLASSSNYDSLPKKTGLLDNEEVLLAIRPLPGKTVYEFALANRAVSPFVLREGASMRWSLLANLNNGKGRMGWLELTPGIGSKKDPAQFLDLVLTE